MRQGTQKVVAVAALAAVAVAVAVGRRPAEPPPAPSHASEARPAAKDPRLVLGRPWFDKLPTKRTDAIDVWFFFGSGYGLHERGSYWRSTMDFFEFERNKDRVDVVFLHDKSRQTIRFDVVACDDNPPFDLCLDPSEPLRGKKRLYSFDDDAEMDAHVPWARDWRASAEARARGPRR